MRTRLVMLLTAVVVAGCQGKTVPDSVSGGGTAPTQMGGTRMGVQKERSKVAGLGERRLEGTAIDLRTTADGKVATALVDSVKPRLDGIPAPMRLGELWAVPTAPGAAPVKLGNGVTNLAGGQLLTADSRFALYLVGYNAAQQTGELFASDLVDLKKEPYRLGAGVSYFVPSDDSRQVAFVEEGVLRLGPLPAGPYRSVAGEVASAEFSHDGKLLLFRRRVAAAGGLFVVATADEKAAPRKLTDLVGDFEVTEDGAHVAWLARTSLAAATFELFTADLATLKPRKLGDLALRLHLSPDGKWLAWIRGETPTQPGELWLVPRDGGEAKKLGEKVRDFVFSSDSSRLAFRQNYREVQLVGEQLEHVGELKLLTLASGEAVSLQKICSNYVFSPDGKALAWTSTTFKPAYTRHLHLLREGAQDAVTLKEWLYEYAFSPDGRGLYFRADCTREGRSCLLYVADVKKAEVPVSQVADAVFNFRFSQDGKRLLYSYAQTQNDMYDVSVVDLATKARKAIEQDIRQPAFFLDPAGQRLAYIVGAKSRPGVYVAEATVP